MATGWLQVGNVWYYFDGSGYMKRNYWVKTYDGKTWCYLKDDGAMATGWNTIDGDTYYMQSSNGYCVLGWNKIDGKTYHFSQYGKLDRNTVIDGYKVDENGVWVQ